MGAESRRQTKQKLKSTGQVDSSRMAEILQARRKELGFSLPEVAKLANASISTVHRLEGGQITVQLDTVLKVLSVLNIDASGFFEQVAPSQGTTASTFEGELALRAKKNMSVLLHTIADLIKKRPH